jgi:hypothetical protein
MYLTEYCDVWIHPVSSFSFHRLRLKRLLKSSTVNSDRCQLTFFLHGKHFVPSLKENVSTFLWISSYLRHGQPLDSTKMVHISLSLSRLIYLEWKNSFSCVEYLVFHCSIFLYFPTHTFDIDVDSKPTLNWSFKANQILAHIFIKIIPIAGFIA